MTESSGFFIFGAPRALNEKRRNIINWYKTAEREGGVKEMTSITDWFIGGLYLAFILGIVLYAYYEIRIKFKR
jgi:hypothetical protein